MGLKEGAILHEVRIESVPESERPAWGTPDWETPWGRLFGSLRAVPVGDRDTGFHGDLQFYKLVEHVDGQGEWFEYVARFTDGQLQWLRRVKNADRDS